MENEIWKSLTCFNGVYEVSSLGRVKSNKYGKEKILSLVKNGKYHRVAVLYNKKTHYYLVHQLVAMAFLEHIPCGFDLVVNHKNFDTLDNRVENLEVVTHRVNTNKKHLKSTSKYTGVHWDKEKGKWRAAVNIKGKVVYIGRFDLEIDASLAYENYLKSKNIF